jgi:tetratricopeptide (TPR) repeat protein
MFRKSARLKANSHRPFLGFGKMFLATGDKQKAVEALEVASARAQEDGAPDLILGRIRERDGERAPALQCYRKAYEKDNADPEAMQLFFRTGMALEEYDTVRETFENVLEKKPASLSLKKRLALVAIKTGRFTDAADLLESCREAAPDDVEVQQLSRMVPTEIVAESLSGETANFAVSEECSPEEAGGCVPEGARLSLSLPETGMNPPVQRDWVGT